MAVSSTAGLLVGDADGAERLVTIRERIFIGRQCLGVDDAHRLLLDGDEVSRDHCHIVIDPETGGAALVDTSTNGTLLNGIPVERSVPTAIGHGDRLTVGGHGLQFISDGLSDNGQVDLRRTVRSVRESPMCVVCGDLLDYTALTERHGAAAVSSAMGMIFDAVHGLLGAHRGTLSNYVGDAFLAVWDQLATPDAARRGAAFALAAAERLAEIGPSLPLRGPDDSPLRMGWAVTFGVVVESVFAGSRAALLGDPVNLGFRLAALAGRDGRADVIVTEEVHDQLGGLAEAGPAEIVTVKGRSAPASVRPLIRLDGG